MQKLIDSLEQIVYSGMAITTVALQEAAGGDLTLTQWRAIVLIGRNDDGCRVSEIAKQVNVTVPATSRLLRRLQRRGLIELRRDDTDGRATRAMLTDEGAELRSAVLAGRRKRLTSIAENVGLARSAHGVVLDLAKAFERETA